MANSLQVTCCFYICTHLSWGAGVQPFAVEESPKRLHYLKTACFAGKGLVISGVGAPIG